jgi:hypothetical protein
MSNPFVTPPASAPKRLMPNRTALVPGGGVPASECLDNWMPEELVEGALCFVLDQDNVYWFDKFSTTAPAGVTVIATLAGVGVPGRWKLLTAPTAPMSYQAIAYDGMSVTAADGNYTEFSPLLNCTDIKGSGLLTFDGGKKILVGADMFAKIDFFLSWYVESGAVDAWRAAAWISGGTVAGGETEDNYNPATPNLNSVMRCTTIALLAIGDDIELRAAIQGAAPGVITADFATLSVTQIA